MKINADNIVLVDPESLTVLSGNPNRMSGDEQERLEKNLEAAGFNLPILISHEHILIDGEHRRDWAIRKKLDAIPAVVVEADESQVRALRLSVNKLRGQIDLAKAASEAAHLHAVTDWTAEDLGVLLGTSADELADLLEIANEAAEDLDILGRNTSIDDGPDPDERTKPWALEIEFEDRKQYQRVRRKLKRAAGKGGSLRQGLLRVLEMDQD